MSALNDRVPGGTDGGAFLMFISSGLRRIGYRAPRAA
jgi:hypothetical protein